MSPFIRLNHNYFFLIASILLIALICRLQAPNHTMISGESTQQSQVQKRAIQNKALGNVVGGAIGIQEERGDSVFVYSR